MNRWLMRLLWVGGFSLALFVLATPTKASADCGWSYTNWTQQVGQGSCGWQQGGYKNANFYFSGQISLPSEVQRIEFYNGSIDDIGEMTANGVMVYHDPSGCGTPGYPTVQLTSPGSVVNMYLHTVDSCGGSTGGNIQFTFYRNVAPPPVVVGCSASPNPVPLGQATTLTGYGSDPGAGVITQFQWDFGDGTTASRDERVRQLGDANQAGSRDRDQLRSPLGRWLAPSAQAGGGGGGPSGPPITLAASPAMVTLGESSTLSWSVSSNYTNTFTLVASNQYGTVSQQVTVAVAEGPSDRNLVWSGSQAERGGKLLQALLQPEIVQAGGGGEEPGPLSIQSFYYLYNGTQNGPVPNGATVRLFWSIQGVPSSVTINGNTPPVGTSLSNGSMDVQAGRVIVTSNFVSGAMATSGSVAVTPSFLNQYTVSATDPTGTNSQSISINVLVTPVTHTYLAPGTYSVTLRAISSSGNTGTGGCLVTVLAPPAPTVDVQANGLNGPLTLPYGSQVTLTWTSANSTACTASDAWSGSKPTSGIEQTAALATGVHTFTLGCTGPAGSAADVVVVTIEPPPVPVVDIQAYKSGGTSTNGPLELDFNYAAFLTWTTQHATSCVATEGAPGWAGAKPLQEPSGLSTGNLTATTNFVLTCTGLGGSHSDSVLVRVNPPPSDFPRAVFEGSFVAPRIELNRQGELKIEFDPQIQANPPPGFTDLVPPRHEEGT